MGALLHLSSLAARQVVAGAVKVVAFKASEVGLDGVVGFLTDRFTDHSQRLPEALRKANERAWTTLEVALEGESLWRMLDRAEDKALRQQVRNFLDAVPLEGLPGNAEEFRLTCARELRAARQAGLLTGGGLEIRQLAEQTAAFARFSEPQALVDAETQTMQQIADLFRKAGHHSLAYLIALRHGDEPPLLVLAVRYFFRREVETDPQLFQGLAWANLEAVRHQQDLAFAILTDEMETLKRLLADVHDTVKATHGAVLDVLAEQQRQGDQLGDLYSAVIDLKRRYELDAVEVRPGDSLALTGDNERRLVRAVLERFRALPEAEQRRLPALLNSLAQLEVASGDLAGAQRDFREVAGLVSDHAAQAEAQHNLFAAALEKQDYAAALDALKEAARFDPERFAPCPLTKYEPEKILGAGGFGIALLCRNRHSGSRVVVKALRLEMLERHVADVFREARVLEELEHPAIIRVRDCDYADAAQKRPYLVMDWFDGPTLAAHLEQHGPLSADDLPNLAMPVAEALAAAHARGILHRDVKPANLLVRREGNTWRVKLIDFGLAQKQRGDRTGTATTYQVAGTAEYAAPEQLGRLPGVAVGPHTDVYGFAKTCCFALFGTTQPLRKHWHSIPETLADLLEQCLNESPKERIADFAEVLDGLKPIPIVKPTSEPAAAAPQWWRQPPPSPAQRDGGPRLFQGHTDAVLSVAFLPDCHGTLTAGVDRTVRLWDLKTGEHRRLDGHADRVWCVQALPDGKAAVSSSTDKSVRIWDLATGKEMARFDNRTNRAVAVSPDGVQAATGSPVDGMVRIWHLRSGKELARLKGHMSWVVSLVFHPQGRYLLSASADGTVRIWDLENGKEVKRLEGHKDPVLALAIDDGTRLRALTSGADRTVRVWSLKGAKQLRGFTQTPEVVPCLAMAANGQVGIWQADADPVLQPGAPRPAPGTLALWDLETGLQLQQLEGHTAKVSSVALSPDGGLVLAGATDGTVRLWRLAR
jgi:serine/threonine protein kinase